MSKLEALRIEHHKKLKEIAMVAGVLSNSGMELKERLTLCKDYRKRLSEAIELEAQLLDIVTLKFRHN